MTEVANEIAKIARQTVERKGARSGPSLHVRVGYVNIAGLPETGYERLVGREAELKRLDDAWDDAKTNILSLVAEGGAGKSALVNEWLKRLQADSYRGAEVVLGWSFYSQGTKERAASAEEFLNWALDKLGLSSRLPAPPPRARRSPRPWRSAAHSSFSMASNRCSTASPRSGRIEGSGPARAAASLCGMPPAAAHD